MTEFVLDVSVALAWFIDNPVPKYAAQVRHALQAGRRAVVPPIWQLEIANAFVVAERRRMLSAEDVTLSLTQLEQLLTQTIESLNDFVSAKYALSSARRFQLSAYDAVYLQTALDRSLPLATLDNALRAAAERAGVQVFR